MTDQEMDARLRAAGERFRTEHADSTATVDVAEVADTAPVTTRRRSRYLLTAAAAWVVALVVGLAVALRGAPHPRTPNAESAGLEHNVWLVSTDGRPSTAALYISHSGALVADDECRLISATVRADGGVLTFTDATTRLKPCTDQYGPGFYQKGTQVLRGHATFHIDSKGMTITHPGVGSLRFVLAQTPIPPPSADIPMLTGTDWVAKNGKVLHIDPHTRDLSGGWCSGRVRVKGSALLTGCGTFSSSIAGSTLTLQSAPPHGPVPNPAPARKPVVFQWRPLDASVVDPESLLNRTWHLTSVTGASASSGSLRIDGNTAVVNDGCATYRRSVQVQLGTFRIAGRAPAHACTDQATTADSFIFNSPATWAVRDGKLIVYGGGAQAFALVYRTTAPTEPLAGSWELTRTLDAQGRFRPVTAHSTLTIDSHGAVSGTDGCRTFTGTVQDDVGAATFTLTMPEPACAHRIEKTAMLVDRVFEKQVRYQLGPTALVLRAPGVGTLTFTDTSGTGQDPALLTANAWRIRLITFGNGRYRDGARTADPGTVRFTDTGYRAVHHCEIVVGQALVRAGTVTLSGGHNTSFASCPVPSRAMTEASQAIDAILSGEVRWTVDGTTLTLETNDGTLVLHAVPAGSQLKHSRWRLTGTQHGSVSSSAVGDVDLAVGSDHLSIVRCYISGATIATAGNRITVRNLHVTHARPCPSGPPGAQQQNDFIDQVLHGAVSWRIDGDRLILRKGNDALMFTRRR